MKLPGILAMNGAYGYNVRQYKLSGHKKSIEEVNCSVMKVIFSRIRFNTRQVVAMAVFVMIASAAQMISPTLVSWMIDSVSGSDEKRFPDDEIFS